MSDHFVVIGAGVSGMAAALILARQGHKVTLVERAPRLAPLLRGFARHGLRFDSGFHYAGALGKGQVLSAYLEHLGVGRHLQLEPEPVSDLLRFLESGEDLALPYGYELLEEALCQRFPRECEGISNYLCAVRRIFDATPFLNLEAEDEPAYTELHGTSLERALNGWVQDPVLRHVLALHHFFYGVPPQGVTFQEHARFVGSYYASTRFVKGGGRALARAFQTALDEAGVTIHCGRGVAEVLCSAAGSLSGVRLEDGENLACSGVIATVHPQVLTQLAPLAAFRPAYRANLQGLRETPSAYMLFGRCTEPLPLLQKGALHIIPKTGTSLAGLREHPLERRQLFAAQAGEHNAKGEQPLGVICPAQHEEMDGLDDNKARKRSVAYSDRKEEVSARLESLLLQHCPELEGCWQRIEAATPLTFRRFAHTPTGSLYGVQHAMDARCPLPQTRLPGFYVAGQAVAGPGVLGATVSAYVACSRILGLRPLLDEVRQCL